ncbi:hypothetical protein V3N99_00390 [Dermatophilaceae bacterium Soc4.6]
MTDAATPITERNAVATGELLSTVERLLAERADELARQGRSLRSLGDLGELAARMVAVLPSVHPYDTAIGPFYDTGGLSQWLGVSRQALADRVRRGTLLACRTQDGHLLYPLFQFARSGEVRVGIVDVVGTMTRAGVDGWVTGTWLTTPSPVFDGDSAVDHLVVHHASRACVARVVAAAAADVASWAR